MSGAAVEGGAKKPLEGLRVLVLRPEGQGEELAQLLRDEGAEPLVIPAVRIVPPEDWSGIDSVLERMPDFDWLVFTSVNGVDMFLRRAQAGGSSFRLSSTRLAAIGPGTRDRLEKGGLTVAWMPSAYTTQALASELPIDPPGSGNSSSFSSTPRVCLLRADIASEEMDKTLAVRGFQVERVNAYGTEPINAAQIAGALHSVHAVALTSASIANSFAQAVDGPELRRVRLYSIGPATSEACRAKGLQVAAEAGEHTLRGLVEALKGHTPARYP